MSCLDLFARITEHVEKALLIDEQSPDCACEAASVSPHSPGIVANDETVWRLILSPVHYDTEEGKVKEAAFHDVANKGMSVQRMSIIGDENAIRHQGLTRAAAAAKQDRTFECAIGANVGIIRSLCGPEGEGRFCVYDTANANDPGHADVCLTKQKSKTARAVMRRELQKAFALEIKPRQT